ncbi:MAG: response regulator transcription factor [Burkholderiales bacterium]|nr:MAG: response regulator transcription factor [Burkholderiales bacterium]
MRILVVEDEPTLRSQLRAQLAARGYTVDAAGDGEEGLYLGTEHPMDLAIVDLGLPGISGIELIRKLRAQDRAFPILILTARDAWQDKVLGLESGADDYLTKPFQPEELLARVNALLRRAAGHSTPVLSFAGIEVDTAAQTVRCRGQDITLTAHEYRILEYLVVHAGKVVSKTELTEHVYDQDFDRDSNVLEVLIGRIRRKIDPDGVHKPIETLRGRGYRLVRDDDGS